ncbi:putative rhamnogalacturonan lyase in rhamnose utilization cluster [Cystobacter fuscus DSM 2262]|uniref:Rhamnogalacturonan lyase in rhamnose utilization cluster n=1 Tax=Cystobacter fuscus (strain ATCC 25194 / DSM 2262 / NBRC 100088 / M29) TaxID=1242864 RepID=S9P190_CYSF2|nr:putative rhamnogalacturonan lyase in rhamnose utilization cluster [Cystobacter fuscus DSM 2262]
MPASNGGTLVSWRLLATDPAGVGFHVYRDGTRLTTDPLTDRTNMRDTRGTSSSTYTVRAVVNGSEQAASPVAAIWSGGYLNLPLQKPAGGTTPDGVAYTYVANDASVGDLNGDGQYELVLKWDPTNAKDNSQSGYTGNVYLDAYQLNGTRLWRIDLGRNIRAGAHYTQFQVFDYDGNGRAEVVMKTADGTVDGQGRVIGNASADHRNSGGYVLAGPEFLTVFEGTTGRALSTVNYVVPRHPDTQNPSSSQLNSIWGDNYGNRVDRFLAATAYLDGSRPSIIMARGYYTRTTVTAWDFRNGSLTQRWLFDSRALGDSSSTGQGNHQLSIADVDGDGRDEILYGAMALDDNGTRLWTSGLGHGDAMHVSDLIPSRPGLERFGVHESPGSNGGIGAAMLDGRTGQRIWTSSASSDVGRGISADIDPRYPGAEAWASNSSTLYSSTGQNIGTRPGPMNFAIWWDGDKQRELLDGVTISKWNYTEQTLSTLLSPSGTASNNGTKANPVLSADILGDWREELIVRTTDSTALRIYSSPYSSSYRYVTLMHDPVYRLGVAWQNTAYNQPPHLGYFIGDN